VTGYRVERCQGAGCTTFAQVATPTGTSFSDTGLAAGMSYSYQVRAADAAGKSQRVFRRGERHDFEHPAVGLVQHVSKDAGITTSSTLAFPTGNTAGNWLAVVIRAGKSGQVFTATDTRGNTYRRAVQFNERSTR